MKDENIHDAGEDAATAPAVSDTSAELEQLRAENENLRQAIRRRDARQAAIDELKKENARSPELLFASVQDEIQFDRDGRPANIAAVVAELKSNFPEQFGTDAPASIDAGAGRTDQNDFLTREALAKMKPQEIARLDWNDVRSVLAN